MKLLTAVLAGIYGNLVTRLGFFGLGWLSKWGWDKISSRGPRKFWKPFFRGAEKPTLFVSEFPPDNAPKGAMWHWNSGEARGVMELSAHLGALGFALPEVGNLRTLPGKGLRLDLISIGGPLSNPITARMLDDKAIPNRTLVFCDEDKPSTICDKSDKRNWKHYNHDGSGDYCLIVAAANPLEPDRDSRVLIVAGSGSYGSWAGCEFATTAEFQKLAKKYKHGRFECLVETQIIGIGDTPQKTKPITDRSLA